MIAPSGPIRIYSVHLDHVSVTERTLQIRHLKERAYAYAGEGGAISGSAEYGFPEPPRPQGFVLMGDFNMDRFSPEYMLMTGEQDAAVARGRRRSGRRLFAGRRLARRRGELGRRREARDEQADRLRLRRAEPCREGRQGLDRPRGEGFRSSAGLVRTGVARPDAAGAARLRWSRPVPQALPGLAVEPVALDRHLA